LPFFLPYFLLGRRKNMKPNYEKYIKMEAFIKSYWGHFFPTLLFKSGYRHCWTTSLSSAKASPLSLFACSARVQLLKKQLN